MPSGKIFAARRAFVWTASLQRFAWNSHGIILASLATHRPPSSQTSSFVSIVLATKWLRILSISANDKTRNHLVANPMVSICETMKIASWFPNSISCSITLITCFATDEISWQRQGKELVAPSRRRVKSGRFQ